MSGIPGLLPVWLLFISTALNVYGRNVEEFYPTIRLFVPNVLAFAVASCAWLCLALVWRRPDSLIRFSFGLTVGTLIYTTRFGHNHDGSRQLLLLTFAAIAVPLVTVASRTIKARTLQQFLLACLVLTVGWDAWTFRQISERTSKPSESARSNAGSASPSGLPNIYHFVFDAFQSDVFSDVSAASIPDTLRGFTWFRNTAPSSADTVNALAEIFSSHQADDFLWTAPDWAKRRDEFYKDAHSGSQSLKSRLKVLGYKTAGHVYYPTQYPHFSEDFDEFISHYVYVEVAPSKLDDTRLFFSLWAVSVLPPRVSEFFVPNIANQRLTGRATLSRFPSLVSYAAVEKFLGEEYSQPAAGRYTFFHVLLPHKPFVFNESCETIDKDWGDAPDDGAVRGQYGCATALIRDILTTLKRLDRFDQSMVIIQGDHGDGFRKDAAGKYSRVVDRNAPDTFTRPVLLVKPPLSTQEKPLSMSQFPARVDDITRTILSRVDPAGGGSMKGVDLLKPSNLGGPRHRDFYWETETAPLRYQIDEAGRLTGPHRLEPVIPE